MVAFAVGLLLVGYIYGASHYKDNGNGTVLDTRTNLVWQKCSKGQDAKTCSGEAEEIRWDKALQYCKSLKLAGRSWRLPSRGEMFSILEEVQNKEDRYIDPKAFPHTAPFYWTSTEVDVDHDLAWAVYFGNGNVGSGYKTSTYYVRCVSSGP